MNLLPFKNKRIIPPGTTFTLTELGRSKAENFTGDERTRVLMALESNGASNIDEISRYSRVRKGKIERMIPSLMRGNLIQTTGGAVME